MIPTPNLSLPPSSLGNVLRHDAIAGLGRALTTNTHLRHLDLSYNHLSVADCETLNQSLRDNVTLIGRQTDRRSQQLQRRRRRGSSGSRAAAQSYHRLVLITLLLLLVLLLPSPSQASI